VITQAKCLSFKVDLWNGVHQPGDEYRMALYTGAASLDEDTAAYTATGEVVGVGYTAGGQVLTGRVVALDGVVAYLSFDDPVWDPATIAADGALVYNATRSNKALAVFAFGSTVSSTNGPFTVDLPAAGASALLALD
jgi:hypothetical protein